MVNNSKAKKEGFYGRSKKAFINFFSFHKVYYIMVSYNKGLGFLKVYPFSLFFHLQQTKTYTLAKTYPEKPNHFRDILHQLELRRKNR